MGGKVTADNAKAESFLRIKIHLLVNEQNKNQNCGVIFITHMASFIYFPAVSDVNAILCEGLFLTSRIIIIKEVFAHPAFRKT